METVGAYYENSLDQVNQPGKGPGGSDGYYIPNPDSSMTCSQLQTYHDSLDNQINYWYSIIAAGSNNSRELENLNKIISVQRSKKDQYSDYMLRNCTTAPTTTVEPLPTEQPPFPDYDPGQTGLPPEPVEEKKTNWLLIGGVGAAVLLLTRKKRGGAKRKRVSGVGGGIMPLLLLAGGGYLLYKNAGGTGSKKNYLLTVATSESGNGGEFFKQVINQMTDQEIADTYTFFKEYVNKGLRVPENSDLWYAIQAISNKYNIFT